MSKIVKKKERGFLGSKVFWVLLVLFFLLAVLIILWSVLGKANTYVVTNTNDSGAGSLRQAILDVNSNSGADYISFNIPTSDPNFNGQWWTITLASALPVITEAVNLDGFTQTQNVGDLNTGMVGTGGTVGVDQISLPRYEKVEIEIKGNSHATDCLAIGGNASDVIVQGMAVYFCDEALNANGGTGTNRLVQKMLIGTRADGSDPGLSERNNDFGVRQINAGELRVNECYVGYNGEGGLVGEASNTVFKATYNEVFMNGWGSDAHDGIDFNGVNGEAKYNLSWGNACSGTTNTGCGSGIELGSQTENTGNNLVENNTVYENRMGITVRKGASGNLIRRNIVTRNENSGILLADEGGITVANMISENSIYQNSGLGIDINADGATSPGDGVTVNNGSKNTGMANDEMDFPVITGSILNGSNLTISGYVGSASGQALFANSKVEFFKSSYDGSTNPNPIITNDSSPYHGEGKTYLGYLTAGADGNFSGNFDVLGKGLIEADWVTATAADTAGSTSEFGENFQTEENVVDLELSKTKDGDNRKEGESVIFTLSLENKGPDNATGVQVKDQLPSGLTYVSSTASSGSYDSISGIWNVGNLNSGETITLELKASVDSGTGGSTLENMAEVIAINQRDSDSTPNNNDINEDDQDNESLVVDKSSDEIIRKVSILKTAEPVSGTVTLPGDVIVYKVDFKNDSNTDLEGVILTDDVSETVDYQGGTLKLGSVNLTDAVDGDQGEFDGGKKQIKVHIGDLDEGGSGNFSFSVKIKGIEYSKPGVKNYAVFNSKEISNLNSNITSHPVDPIEIKKIGEDINGGLLLPGDEILWRITITNVGFTQTTHVVVEDTLPESITYVEKSITGRGANDSDSKKLKWDIGVLELNEQVELSFKSILNAGVPANTEIKNQAMVDCDQCNPKYSDNPKTVEVNDATILLAQTGKNVYILIILSVVLILAGGVILYLAYRKEYFQESKISKKETKEKRKKLKSKKR
jgi:uncharacterized repeat protein (TIGR01451 family)